MKGSIELSPTEVRAIIDTLELHRRTHSKLVLGKVCEEHEAVALKTLRRIDALIEHLELKLEGRI